MQSIPLSTEIFRYGDDFNGFLRRSLRQEPLREGDVLAITSKIVSLAEGRIRARDRVTSKADLIREEAEHYLGHGAYDCHLTIKHGALLPSAGIDESNSQQGDFILLPQDPYGSARRVHGFLSEAYGVKNFGIIITDSHTTPLRRGVTGISLGHFGFRGVKSLIDHEDLFGRKLKFTYVNHVDSLAAMAVYEMGEADDRKPLVIVRGRKDLHFGLFDTRTDVQISPEEDLYLPILSRCPEKIDR